MADMHGFGKMDWSDRGGRHDYYYDDVATKKPSAGLTPSQTLGPFFAYGLTPGAYSYPHTEIHSNTLVTEAMEGDRITIEGHVYDGNGNSVHDAMVEIIQADSAGQYARKPRNDGFTGYGRFGTGATGKEEVGGDTRFRFHTIKPGITKEGTASFITVVVTMRGLLNHYITRMYFPEDNLSRDPVVRQVPQKRRHTLVCRLIETGKYEFDIHMQGEQETVFFDL